MAASLGIIWHTSQGVLLLPLPLLLLCVLGLPACARLVCAALPMPLQGLVLLLCALGPEELSEVRLGPLTPQAVLVLRHIREFFNVQFRWVLAVGCWRCGWCWARVLGAGC